MIEEMLTLKKLNIKYKTYQQRDNSKLSGLPEHLKISSRNYFIFWNLQSHILLHKIERLSSPTETEVSVQAVPLNQTELSSRSAYFWLLLANIINIRFYVLQLARLSWQTSREEYI